MLRPEQCLAARALLRWSQKDLAKRAGVGDVSIRRFETRQSGLRESTARLIRKIFEEEGVILIDPDDSGGSGARLVKDAE